MVPREGSKRLRADDRLSEKVAGLQEEMRKMREAVEGISRYSGEVAAVLRFWWARECARDREIEEEQRVAREEAEKTAEESEEETEGSEVSEASAEVEEMLVDADEVEESAVDAAGSSTLE